MYSEMEMAALNELTKMLLSDVLPDQPKQAIDALTRVINYHDWRYYSLSDPIVADFEYDQLFKNLQRLEEENPKLLNSTSPTQRIAASLNDGFNSVAHTVPMLSLDNSYNADDLIDFDRKMKELTGQQEVTYVVEPKFDGASIALIYENDELVRAATRGNGTLGDDITNNGRVIRSIPLKASFSKFGIQKIELRGEVIIEKSNFEQLNESRVEQGLEPFQNARNTASGGLRMKDPQMVAQRNLEAFIYQIGYVQHDDGSEDLRVGESFSQFENINVLGKLGFQIPRQEKAKFKGINQVIDFATEWEEKRDTYNYEIDGLVVKVDDYRLQEQIGSTSHHPRWAMAFKFKAKQATTKLLNIEYQVGRTGAITPVAKVEPVHLAGVTISSISLHNDEMIQQKDIRIGDTVIVERAGDVIPYIVGPVKDLRKGTEQQFHFITQCPSCHSELVQPNGEAAWRCVNVECPAQAEERIIHFVSKNAMDISGLGKDIVKRFIEEGLIEQLIDIYHLKDKKEDILGLDGWKERSVNKLLKGIEDSKKNPAWRLLVGLGVRHVGTTMAKQLTKEVSSLTDFANFKQEQLETIDDVGPKVAESILEFFGNDENMATLNELSALGVNIACEQPTQQSQKLEGQTFLFTGSLTQFTRDEAKALVEQHGGKTLSGVSKNLDVLVAGEKAGSKLTKAQVIGTIDIITEDEFLQRIQD